MSEIQTTINLLQTLCNKAMYSLYVVELPQLRNKEKKHKNIF